MMHKVIEAYNKIKPFLVKTPIISLDELDNFLGHNLYFKLEILQETGSFKVRGALNALLSMKKDRALPKKIVTYGTGNHALALAWVGKKFGVKEVKVYLPHFTSEIKKKLAKRYGANVVITNTRKEAEAKAYLDAGMGYKLIPSSGDEDVINGAGTVVYEALDEIGKVEAVFVPIGGGSLSAGTVLLRDSVFPGLKVYAGEPKNANDASISYRTGRLFRFEDTPQTIADGATALGLSKKVFKCIKGLDGIYEITEKEIAYWTIWFSNLSGVGVASLPVGVTRSSLGVT